MIQLRMEDLRFRGFFPFFIIWLYPDRGHVGFLELAPAKLAELTSCPALGITSLIKNTITVKILYGLKDINSIRLVVVYNQQTNSIELLSFLPLNKAKY